MKLTLQVNFWNRTEKIPAQNEVGSLKAPKYPAGRVDYGYIKNTATT